MDFFGGSMVKWQAQLISGHFVGAPHLIKFKYDLNWNAVKNGK